MFMKQSGKVQETNRVKVQSKETNGLSKERLLDAYRIMYTARKTDDKILLLLKQGKVFFHIGGSGHEAIQVATGFAMRRGDDWSYPYYRDLAFAITMGYSVKDVLAEAMHRATGPSSAGFVMPFNYGHKKWRIVSQSSPTGTQYLQAVGTAGKDLRVRVNSTKRLTGPQGRNSQLFS
jgi:2-oxoisovalerate dehydrogenase E1 component